MPAATPTTTSDSPACIGSPAKRSALRSDASSIAAGDDVHPSGDVRAQAPKAPAHSPIATKAIGPPTRATSAAASADTATASPSLRSKSPCSDGAPSTTIARCAMNDTVPASLDARQSGRGASAGCTATVPPTASPSPKCPVAPARSPASATCPIARSSGVACSTASSMKRAVAIEASSPPTRRTLPVHPRPMGCASNDAVGADAAAISIESSLATRSMPRTGSLAVTIASTPPTARKRVKDCTRIPIPTDEMNVTRSKSRSTRGLPERIAASSSFDADSAHAESIRPAKARCTDSPRVVRSTFTATPRPSPADAPTRR